MSQVYDYNKPEFRAPLESEPIRQNFQALATCHAGDDPPSQLWEGMLWLRTSDGVLLQYIAGAWKIVSYPGEHGLGRIYRKAITPTDLSNKFILLPPPYVSPENMLVHVEGAPILRLDEDYSVTSNMVIWAGLTLEFILREGDVIVVQY